MKRATVVKKASLNVSQIGCQSSGGAPNIVGEAAIQAAESQTDQRSCVRRRYEGTLYKPERWVRSTVPRRHGSLFERRISMIRNFDPATFGTKARSKDNG
jgi:hypothetical protein